LCATARRTPGTLLAEADDDLTRAARSVGLQAAASLSENWPSSSWANTPTATSARNTRRRSGGRATHRGGDGARIQRPGGRHIGQPERRATYSACELVALRRPEQPFNARHAHG